MAWSGSLDSCCESLFCVQAVNATTSVPSRLKVKIIEFFRSVPPTMPGSECIKRANQDEAFCPRLNQIGSIMAEIPLPAGLPTAPTGHIFVTNSAHCEPRGSPTGAHPQSSTTQAPWSIAKRNQHPALICLANGVCPNPLFDESGATRIQMESIVTVAKVRFNLKDSCGWGEWSFKCFNRGDQVYGFQLRCSPSGSVKFVQTRPCKPRRSASEFGPIRSAMEFN